MSTQATHQSSDLSNWESIPQPTPEHTTQGFIQIRRPSAATSCSVPDLTFIPLALDSVVAQTESLAQDAVSPSTSSRASAHKKRSVSDAHIQRDTSAHLVPWHSFQSLTDLIGKPFTHRTAEPAVPAEKPIDFNVLKTAISLLVCFLSQPEALKTKWLFREPGSQKQIGKLVATLQKKPGQLSPETDVKNAAGSLLRLYKKIEFPTEFTDELLRISQGEPFERLELVEGQLGQLALNYQIWAVVQEMMYFLAKVERHKAENLMDAPNLGFSFGPVFYGSMLDAAAASGSSDLYCQNQALASRAFQCLLSYYIDKLVRSEKRALAAQAQKWSETE